MPVSTRRKALPIVILADESGVKGLAFGLQWRSVVTSGGRASAISMASTGGGTHYIFRGQQLGFGYLPTKGVILPARVYPAAVIAAQQHVGDCIFVIRTGESEFWVALTRNGSPTSYDQYLLDASEDQALEIARMIQAQLNDDGVEPNVFTNIEDHGFASVRSISIEEILNGAVGDGELLDALPKRKSSIPKPVIVIAGIAMLGLGANAGYKYWTAKRAQQALQAAPVDEEDVLVWTKALKDWESTIPAPDRNNIQAVRNSISDVPVHWHGWLLNGVVCLLSAPDKSQASSRKWVCKASYNRQPSGLLNRDMEKQVPSGWAVTFQPMNLMFAQWEIKQSGRPIGASTLKKQAEHLLKTTSSLQILAAGFSKSVEFVFAPILIASPKRLDGSAYMPNSIVSGLSKATVSVQGPLRTIDAVIDTDLDVVWKSLSVSYESNGGKVSIQSSEITAELTGDIYAKN